MNTEETVQEVTGEVVVLAEELSKQDVLIVEESTTQATVPNAVKSAFYQAKVGEIYAILWVNHNRNGLYRVERREGTRGRTGTVVLEIRRVGTNHKTTVLSLRTDGPTIAAMKHIDL